jgi:endonuclease-3
LPGVARAQLRRAAAKIDRRLRAEHPDAHCALIHRSPFELLIATILSAQCTDERVNGVTPALFAEFPDARSMAGAEPAILEKLIQSTGFYRAKARSIRGCCAGLVERHGGEVPRALEALVALPGVGRKTANVVLGTAFGIPSGVVVDTHVGRISRRLGLTVHADAVKAERDLMELLPRRSWVDFSHRLIFHGRRVCRARRPNCVGCSLRDLCPQVGVPRNSAAGGASS